MSDFLADVISASRTDTNQMLERTKAALSGGPSPSMAMLSTPGTPGGPDGGNRAPTLQTHAEQLRHNTGWVYAALRPIGDRVAAQPIRLARVKRMDKKTRPAPGKKHYIKSWEKLSLQKRMADKRDPRRPNKATLPYWLKSSDEDLDVLENHPFLDAINRPNPIMVRSQLMKVTVDGYKICGKAFWWIRETTEEEAGPEGQDPPGTLQIWPVPASWIEPVHKDEKDEPFLFHHWRMRPNGTGEWVDIPRSEIAYIYNADPGNPFGCMSDLAAQARAVVCDENISEAQRRAFSNGLFPGLAIIAGRHPDISGKGPGERPYMTTDQRKMMINSIKQHLRGVANMGEPMILDSMIEDVKPITTAPREMEFMKSGEMTKKRIVQGMGTNEIVMGEIEGANRASAVAATSNMDQWTVNPMLELFSQCLTAWVGPAFADEDEDLICYFEQAHETDPDSRRADLQFLIGIGGLTVNDCLGEYGFPALDPEVGDVVWMDPNKIKQPLWKKGEKKPALPPPEEGGRQPPPPDPAMGGLPGLPGVPPGSPGSPPALAGGGQLALPAPKAGGVAAAPAAAGGAAAAMTDPNAPPMAADFNAEAADVVGTDMKGIKSEAKKAYGKLFTGLHANFAKACEAKCGGAGSGVPGPCPSGQQPAPAAGVPAAAPVAAGHQFIDKPQTLSDHLMNLASSITSGIEKARWSVDNVIAGGHEAAQNISDQLNQVAKDFKTQYGDAAKAVQDTVNNWGHSLEQSFQGATDAVTGKLVDAKEYTSKVIAAGLIAADKAGGNAINSLVGQGTSFKTEMAPMAAGAMLFNISKSFQKYAGSFKPAAEPAEGKRKPKKGGPVTGRTFPSWPYGGSSGRSAG